MENHKRYLVFEFEQYYPAGGMDDLTRSYDTLEEISIIPDHQKGGQIYDRIEGILIKKF